MFRSLKISDQNFGKSMFRSPLTKILVISDQNFGKSMFRSLKISDQNFSPRSMSASVNMSRPEVILCAHDEIAVIDLHTIQDTCPPILSRFLGISDDSMAPFIFKEATREQGRLTFAKQLDISRSSFQACITFLKTGYIGSIEVLVRTMDILGGSEKLDAYVAKKQAEIEAREAHELKKLLSERTNPMTPEADVDHLYIWRAGQTGWSQGVNTEDWSMTVPTSLSSIDYWWRMRREGDDEDDEEIEEL